MIKIVFKGHKAHLKKISFTRLLHERTSLSLKDSKEIMDRIIDDETVEIFVNDLNYKVNLKVYIHYDASFIVY